MLNFLTYSRSPPVAQWLHFRASVWKGMAFSPRRETPFFHICSTLLNIFFFNLFFFSLIFFFIKLDNFNVLKPFKKGHKTCLKVNCMRLVIFFFYLRSNYLGFHLIGKACKRKDLD